MKALSHLLPFFFVFDCHSASAQCFDLGELPIYDFFCDCREYIPCCIMDPDTEGLPFLYRSLFRKLREKRRIIIKASSVFLPSLFLIFERSFIFRSEPCEDVEDRSVLVYSCDLILSGDDAVLVIRHVLFLLTRLHRNTRACSRTILQSVVGGAFLYTIIIGHSLFKNNRMRQYHASLHRNNVDRAQTGLRFFPGLCTIANNHLHFEKLV